jgi:hypothetical protein
MRTPVPARNLGTCAPTSGAPTRLDALGPATRAEPLHVLMLPDLERADRIGEFSGYPQSRAFSDPQPSVVTPN